MPKNKTQRFFIEKCLRMSFQELAEYIERCFDNIETTKVFSKNTPSNKETYELLIKLLDDKSRDLQVEFAEAIKIQRKLDEKSNKIEKNFAQSTKENNSEEFLIQLEFLKENLTALKYNENYYNVKLTQWVKEAKDNDEYVNELFSYFLAEQIKKDLFSGIERIKKHNQYYNSILAKQIFGTSLRLEINLKYLSTNYSNKDLIISINKAIEELIDAVNQTIKIVNIKRVKQVEIENSQKNLKRIEETIEKCREYIMFLQNRNKDIFDNLSVDLESKESPPSLKIKKLSWKLLPKGQWATEQIIQIFKNCNFKGSKWQNVEFDETRLRKIQNHLKPSVCYVGEDEFKGYVVFCFDWTEKVVLECPFFGNAIYVINGEWQEITRLSKWEARHKYSKQVTRIVHAETWLNRLRLELES